MNKLQTVYVPVSVEERLPESKRKPVMVVYGSNAAIGTLRVSEFNSWHVTHWLQPTQAILLTQEQFDAYEKCVEALKDAEKYLSETLYENGKPIQLNYIGAGSKLHNDFKYFLSLLTQLNNQL